MTVVTLLVARVAPPRYATEAFTWSATAIVTGVGAGMAAGGALVERAGLAGGVPVRVRVGAGRRGAGAAAALTRAALTPNRSRSAVFSTLPVLFFGSSVDEVRRCAAA